MVVAAICIGFVLRRVLHEEVRSGRDWRTAGALLILHCPRRGGRCFTGRGWRIKRVPRQSALLLLPRSQGCCFSFMNFC